MSSSNSNEKKERKKKDITWRDIINIDVKPLRSSFVRTHTWQTEDIGSDEPLLGSIRDKLSVDSPPGKIESRVARARAAHVSANDPEPTNN